MKTPLHGGVALFDKRVSGKMTADYTVVPSPEEQPNQIMFFPISEEIPTWHDDAVCAQTDPEAFFPEKGGSTREAKRICVNCTVKQECLEYALDFDERFGIWGGLSERERRRLKLRTKLVVLPVPPIQLVPSIERPAAMKDEARFPMVRAFLRKRQGHPFIVYGGDRGKVPGELATAAKIDSVKELRQVLRKMGRAEADTQVTEYPDGTLWVELVKHAAILTPKIVRPTAPVVATPILIKAAAKSGPIEVLPLEEAVLDDRESEIEDLVFEEPVSAEVLTDTVEDTLAELANVEAPVEDINEEVAKLLRAEFDAVLAEEAEARKAASSDESEDEMMAAAVAAIAPAEVIVKTPSIEEPVFVADIPAPREESAEETILSSFVEMELPSGYINPVAPSSRLLYPSGERVFAALSWLGAQPNATVRDRSITPQIQEILGVSTGAASSFVSHLVAEGLIGRVLNGKITRVTWLRQSGWDWIQAYAKGEAAIAPGATTSRIKTPQVVEAPIVASKPAIPPISQTYDLYAQLTEWESEGGAPSDKSVTPPAKMEIIRRDNELQFGYDFTLDIHALCKCYAILGQRGSGKTSTGVVMAEEMIAQGWPVAIIDPQGVWYGLRSTADGKSPGLPVIIFGGSHADVPIEPWDGYMLAELMETGLCSIIIDSSEMDDDEEMQGFMTDFFTGLYHRKRRLPMHVIVDEADEIVPQSNFSKDLIKAATRITKRGRTRGIGSSWISQRPQDINKKILTQAEVLMAMRLMHKLDVQSIEDWIGKNADATQAAKIKSTLASLPTGTGWLWSPAWLGDMQLVQVRQRLTFDSSSTPLPGQFAPEPEVMARVDLSVLPQKLLDRLKAHDDNPSDERYMAALEEIMALAPQAIEPGVIPGKPVDGDDEDDIEDVTASFEEGTVPVTPAKPIIVESVPTPEPEVVPLVSLLAADEVVELIRLRAQIGAMSYAMTDALEQRDEANADLLALHAEYSAGLKSLQGEIANLKLELIAQTSSSKARERDLVEQVIAREIEVTVLEAHLIRNDIVIHQRHLHAVSADEETA